MAHSNDGELDRKEARERFVERAQQALANAEAGGPVFDGTAYADYLRKHVKAVLSDGKSTPKRPQPEKLPLT